MSTGPYVSYHKEDTRIVNYVLTTEPVLGLLRKGWRTAPTVRHARAEVVGEFGPILEENAAGNHVFFRVYRRHT